MNVGGTAHAAELGAPLVAYSIGLRIRRSQGSAVRRVRQPEPSVGIRQDQAARRSRGRGRGLGGAELLALRPDRTQLRPHHAPPRRRARRGRGRRRPARLPHLRRASGGSHTRARRCRLRRSASGTSRRRATAPGPTSQRRSSRTAGLDCRVKRITTAEFGARAPAAAGLDPAQREGGTGATALARGPRRVPRPARAGRVASEASGTAPGPRVSLVPEGGRLTAGERLPCPDARARHRWSRIHRLALRAPARGGRRRRRRPRQAHLRGQSREPRRGRPRVRPGRHRRPGRGGASCSGLRRDRQLRGRDARRPLDPRAPGVRSHRRARNDVPARMGARPRGPLRPGLDRRGVRRPRGGWARARGRSRCVPRAPTALRRPAATCRCSPTSAPTASALRSRAAPTPMARTSIPRSSCRSSSRTRSRASRCPSTATGSRCGSGSTPRITAPASSSSCTRVRPARSTTSAARITRTSRSPTESSS